MARTHDWMHVKIQQDVKVMLASGSVNGGTGVAAAHFNPPAVWSTLNPLLQVFLCGFGN